MNDYKKSNQWRLCWQGGLNNLLLMVDSKALGYEILNKNLDGGALIASLHVYKRPHSQPDVLLLRMNQPCSQCEHYQDGK